MTAHPTTSRRLSLVAEALVATRGLAGRIEAQIAVTSHDTKAVLVNGTGTVALVANRSDGTVSVFGIQGTTPTSLGKVTIADERSGVSHVAIAPDGKSALVTREGDHTLTLLTITDANVDGDTLSDTGQRIKVTGGPTAVRTADK